MAYSAHSTIATTGFINGVREASDIVTEMHNITFTWYEAGAPAVSLGTCTARLKKMKTYWRLEVPATHLSAVTINPAGAGHDVYATFTDTDLLFGAAATVWSAYSNLTQLGNFTSATHQGWVKLTHAAGVLTIIPEITVTAGTTAAYHDNQMNPAGGDMHVYNGVVFEIHAVAV